MALGEAHLALKEASANFQ
uniref:Uncharacterized protein n=1 Tax=Moniliophthora roreri TaxID=221103 RepID=A0A0W0FZX4_MONRR